MKEAKRESDIEGYLIKCVKEVKGLLRKVKWIGYNGAPDRLFMLKGFACWVELKAPGEEPDRLQRLEHRRLRWAGMEVVVIDSYLTVEMLVFRRKINQQPKENTNGT